MANASLKQLRTLIEIVATDVITHIAANVNWFVPLSFAGGVTRNGNTAKEPYPNKAETRKVMKNAR